MESMKIIKRSKNGVDYLTATLRDKIKTRTQAWFWKITHDSGKEDIRLKIGRYKKPLEELEKFTPKSVLTLDNEEFESLINFISENYQPFKDGAKQYIPVDESFGKTSIENLKAIFNNPDKEKLLNFIIQNDILPEELFIDLQYQERVKAVKEFEYMLNENLLENDWQKWFKKNNWILGSEFVKILDERDIDTDNISDYLMQAYDGFLDIIEIKRPSIDLQFFATSKDHDNYIPSVDLTKAITQSMKYIYELERESNSDKFIKRVGGIKTIKPRCVLIFGRSHNWNNEQKEAYRILNCSYQNLNILTYDHVLDRAKRIIVVENEQVVENVRETITDDLPF